ncbi:MAG TPA: saccharopine dehydrogenase C-terminal domain-containing protein [Vicinamibacterales bacterium]|jgi:saccharopine dehydrogenase-like NADP-dependent oxidoreductase|nr:saccharopine dehydrogenase C-terminal domain-containing protein [Vicinamibacterales bacterium]MDP7473275.1 saccharopine dehydrogenase C-terminal domain-containing protein [Vicinamibacterales bacterium]MDP7691754.1 saccharopine dehydrogenase C-terminal domain-containing protein [Vicinamibacterales bacterium]HJO37375.1 saccharopine dehydrogenase C-terminal domain-containing protein [Vicinamibacterales bacterium]|tara:strand:- start:728 stop:904 length:177 start_codon:yes stop_codon:yes gene_type:complete
MARTTGFPAAHAARRIADGTIQDTGVRFPEQVFAGAMGGELLRVLEARGMSIAHDESS